MKKNYSLRFWPFLFTLVLIFPSLGQLLKYTGLPGFILYSIVVYTGLSLFSRHAFPLFYQKVSQKDAVILFVIIMLLLAFNFHRIYPLADAGIIGGGNDRDDALNLAAEQILSLQYPYSVRTYLGNPISPLPGAVLLALPFVILGNSAYQNFFWIILFLIVLYRLCKDFRIGLYLLCTLFLFSPIVMQELLTGGDLLANNLYIFISFSLFCLVIQKQSPSPYLLLGSSLFLGITLCSRFQYIIFLPLLFSFALQNTNWKKAFEYITIAGASALVLGLSFYLANPADFTPLHTYEKLSRFEAYVPFVGILIPLLTVLVTLRLCLCPMKNNIWLLFRNCAIILAIPSLSGLMISIIIQQKANILTFADYGLNYLIFGSVYLWYLFHKKYSGLYVPGLHESKQTDLR